MCGLGSTVTSRAPCLPSCGERVISFLATITSQLNRSCVIWISVICLWVQWGCTWPLIHRVGTESWPTGGNTDSSILCLWICWLRAELTPVSSQQAGFSGVTIAPVSEIADRSGEVASQSPARNLHSVLASALCV